MWKHLFNLARHLLNLAQESERNRTAIKEVRQEMKELTAIVQRLAFEQRRISENEAHEREKLVLVLQNELLTIERRLPGGKHNGRGK